MLGAQPFDETETRASTVKNGWLACPRPNPGARLRLFCFPHSGAGAQVFYPWLDVFPEEIEVCPVQLPGRGTRLAEPPYTRMLPLVQAAAKALVSYLDRPFAFFGHSMGALVSFELTRHLRENYDLRPLHLFVSGHSAPHIPRHQSPIYGLAETEFVERLCQLNGMSKEIVANAELMQLLLPILRADFAVCETYSYTPDRPLECPISALGGLQDEHVSRKHLEAWREHTTDSFSVRLFPGDHFYLSADRSLLVRTLVRELMSCGRDPIRGHQKQATQTPSVKERLLWTNS